MRLLIAYKTHSLKSSVQIQNTLLQWCHMSVKVSGITGNSTVGSTAHLSQQQTKHEKFALLVLCEGNPLVMGDSHHKGSVMQKAFWCYDFTMFIACSCCDKCFMMCFFSSGKKPEISKPSNFEHTVHVGFDTSTGEFTVSSPMRYGLTNHKGVDINPPTHDQSWL